MAEPDKDAAGLNVSRNTVSRDNWRPRKLQTLIVPDYCVVIPDPIRNFEHRQLAAATGHKRPKANAVTGLVDNMLPITIFGELRIADKMVRGANRTVAALLDENKNKVWLDADPLEDIALYQRLYALSESKPQGTHAHIALFGIVYPKGKHWLIQQPEPVPRRWWGSPRPVYERLHHATQRSLQRDVPDDLQASYLNIRKEQNEYLRSVNDDGAFKAYLKESQSRLLYDGLKDAEARYVATGFQHLKQARMWATETLMLAHKPQTLAEFDEAKRRVARAAAVCSARDRVKKAIKQNKQRQRQLAKIKAPTLGGRYMANPAKAIDHWTRHIPFELTPEQREAAGEMLADIESGRPMQRILSGDVGSGKTAVFIVPIAAMLEAGYRVAVISPSGTLAMQTYTTLKQMVPGYEMSLIAGEVRDIKPDAQLWVGTVGIHSNTDHEFDLIVVDEQQRFSRSQREAALAGHGHSIEATATCIPRTQAMIDGGMIDLSILRGCHVEKTLYSAVHTVDQRGPLMRTLKATVDAGEIIAVVYPGKEKDGGDKENDVKLHSVSEHLATWERWFPGQIAYAHGGRKSADNDRAIQRIRDGDARVLVATSIIEVGIDIEGMRRVVVIQPERFGLATLHQLRGRVARDGGTGYFDMVLANEITAKAYRRLDYMTQISDGFELAKYDLKERGGGDITQYGHRQTGQMPDSPFPSEDVDPDVFQQVWEELTAVYIHGIPDDEAIREQNREVNETAGGRPRKQVSRTMPQVGTRILGQPGCSEQTHAEIRTP